MPTTLTLKDNQVTLLHVNLMEILKEFEYSFGALLDAQELEIWDYDRVCLCGRMEEMQFEARSCVRRGIDDHVRAAIGTEPGQWTTDLLCLLDKCLEATVPFTSCNSDHLIQQSQRDLASDLRSELHAKWQTLHNLDAPWNRYSAYQDADPAGPRAESDDDRRYVFRKYGDSWLVAFDGCPCHIKDSTGMPYILSLLTQPEVEFSAEGLGGTAATVLAEGLQEGADAQSAKDDPVADRDGLRKIQHRLSELINERQAAEQDNDTVRVSHINDERVAIEKELRVSYGLSGCVREIAGEGAQARNRLSTAIDRAIKAIGKHHEPLATHLKQSIQKGATYAYRPARDISWRF